MQPIYYFSFLVLGSGGIVGLFTLKYRETQRNKKIVFSSWRTKGDATLLRALGQSLKMVKAWQSINMPDVLSRAAPVFQNAYSAGKKLMKNKPMRLTGFSYTNKGMHAPGNGVSRFLREVSKSKERDRVSEQNVIE